MGETKLQRDARWRAVELRRSIGASIRQAREDAGLTRAAIAAAAGIDASYVTRIERAGRGVSIEVLSAVAASLGADLGLAIHPTTGPVIHDRVQAPMEEGLLRVLGSRWTPTPEVRVSTPARGVIDLALDDRVTDTFVATEFQGQIRRLEQQVRWHREKQEALPSSELWRFASVGGSRRLTTSRLLVLRSTRALRELAATYEATLRAAYPARCADAVASLVGDGPWPGPAVVWMQVEGVHATLMQAPPRGIRLGR
jgi:transcriptional regulator with XRE-family HTH domain